MGLSKRATQTTVAEETGRKSRTIGRGMRVLFEYSQIHGRSSIDAETNGKRTNRQYFRTTAQKRTRLIVLEFYSTITNIIMWCFKEILKDEIYCQIIKQLTDNRNKISEERGWELLWLATGCFAPSAALQKEVNLFLRTRRNQFAPDCAIRLQKTIK